MKVRYLILIIILLVAMLNACGFHSASPESEFATNVPKPSVVTNEPTDAQSSFTSIISTPANMESATSFKTEMPVLKPMFSNEGESVQVNNCVAMNGNDYYFCNADTIFKFDKASGNETELYTHSDKNFSISQMFFSGNLYFLVNNYTTGQLYMLTADNKAKKVIDGISQVIFIHNKIICYTGPSLKIQAYSIDTGEKRDIASSLIFDYICSSYPNIYYKDHIYEYTVFGCNVISGNTTDICTYSKERYEDDLLIFLGNSDFLLIYKDGLELHKLDDNKIYELHIDALEHGNNSNPFKYIMYLTVKNDIAYIFTDESIFQFDLNREELMSKLDVDGAIQVACERDDIIYFVTIERFGGEQKLMSYNMDSGEASDIKTLDLSGTDTGFVSSLIILGDYLWAYGRYEYEGDGTLQIGYNSFCFKEKIDNGE